MGIEKHSMAALTAAADGRPERARQIVRDGYRGEPLGKDKWPSDNHRAQAARVASVILRDDALMHKYLDMLAGASYRIDDGRGGTRHHGGPGIGEWGPLYGPTGGFGECVAAHHSASGQDARRRAGEAVVWYMRLVTPLAVAARPVDAHAVLAGEEVGRDREAGIRGYGWVPTLGPRGQFGHGELSGWEMASPCTHLWQWLVGADGRRLHPRFAWGGADGYDPVKAAGDASEQMWNYIYGAIERHAGVSYSNLLPSPLSSAEREAMIEHARSGAVWSGLMENPVGFRTRFGLEVVRFADGSVLAVCHRTTSGPKTAVAMMDYDGPTRHEVQHAPAGFASAKSGQGAGRIVAERGVVFGEALESPDGDVVSRSVERPIDEVVRHLVMPARSGAGWEYGDLDPTQQEEVEPPPQPIPAPILLWPGHQSEQWGDVEIAWQAVEGATGYEVSVEGVKTITTETMFVASAYQEGPVWWRVRALRDGDAGPWSEPWMFEAVEPEGGTAHPRPKPPPRKSDNDRWKYWVAGILFLAALTKAMGWW